MDLLAAMGVSFASAVVLVIPVEAYLVGYALLVDGIDVVLVAFLVALAHVAGKMLHFFLGEVIVERLQLSRRTQLDGKWADRWDRIVGFSGKHRWVMPAVVLASASISVPPYAPVPFLVAAAGMRWWSFALWSLVGRFARFWAVLAIPQLLPGILFGI